MQNWWKMARLDKVGARYAKAFSEYLADPKRARAVVAELRAFYAVVTSSTELRGVLLAGVVPEATRLSVVADLAEKLGLSTECKRLLGVLCTMKRLGHIESISESLLFSVLQASGIVPMKVESAHELTAEEKKLIESKFEKILGKKTEASYSVTPGILGGVRVSAGSRTFDGSITGGLSRLEESLIGGSI